jgi:hypothetical protein
VPAPIADAPQVATQQSEVPQQEPAASPLTGERRAIKQRNVTRHAAPPPVATERRVAKPVVDSQPPAPKKPAREARGAKPSNEALNAVRKFQDNLRDIPVSSYAADGTQRTIVIRPTSIQDCAALANAGTYIPEARDHGSPLPRGRQRVSRAQLGASDASSDSGSEECRRGPMPATLTRRVKSQ